MHSLAKYVNYFVLTESIHYHHYELCKGNCNKKNARLNARRRLLLKRQCIHENDRVAHYSQLLTREARRARSSLMRLQRVQHSPLQNQPHG